MSSRPRYETPAHLAAEWALVRGLAERWKCDPEKLPIKYGLDYALSRGGTIAAWLEAKCRANDSGKYPTYLLSLHKWLAGLELERETGMSFLLVVEFTDRVMLMRAASVDMSEVTYAMGGRTDRGDPQDFEPCIMLPMKYFGGKP